MQGTSGGKTNTSCLADPGSGVKLISLQMCGNGIVEEGEDCDPGKGSNSSCCDVNTCKFKSGALCDPASSPCCTDSCSFAPTTQVCRPAKDASCDQPEMCTGNSSACPSDSFSPNGKQCRTSRPTFPTDCINSGQSCGSDGLSCANGICTSLDSMWSFYFHSCRTAQQILRLLFIEQCQTVGASMNLKKACGSSNDKTCQVSCQDPHTSNQCIVLQSTLVDGSPCGA